MRILILCTGNSCRSQMAEAYLKSIAPELEVFSAGTEPADRVKPMTIEVMNEIGLDVSGNHPKSVDLFMKDDFDYVVTVCDHARETCPLFLGKVKHRVHIGFEDPADAVGTDEEVLSVYRRIRDEIMIEFGKFYQKIRLNQNADESSEMIHSN